jgi:beta-glucosidase
VFKEQDPAYAELLRVSATTPTNFVTTLERPIILTNVLSRATAVLGDFGIAEEILMDVLTGKQPPRGHLPFELPSSEQAVREHQSDVANHSRDPLFPMGFGLSY